MDGIVENALLPVAIAVGRLLRRYQRAIKRWQFPHM